MSAALGVVVKVPRARLFVHVTRDLQKELTVLVKVRKKKDMSGTEILKDTLLFLSLYSNTLYR